MISALEMFFLFFICGFGAMYLCFAPQVRKYLQTLQFKFYMRPIIYVWLFYCIGSIGAYLSLKNNDFIEPLTLGRVLLPLGLSAVIYATSLFFGRFALTTVIGVAVSLLVLAQPLGLGSSFPDLPIWLVRLGVIVFGILFCSFYKIMNSTAQACIIPLLAILFGVGVLSALGAAPVYCAIAGAVLMGTLTAYLSINYYGDKIDFDQGSCAAVAFLTLSLLVINIGEFCFASCVIFTVIFWAELLAALWYKFALVHSGDLMENCNYYQAATKYSHHILALNIFKICGICIFLGWFQLFLANTFSLSFVALLIILWLNNSLGRSSADEPKTLREINQNFVRDIKQNIKDAKNVLSAQKKDK